MRQREEGRKREKEGEAQQRSSHNACLTTGCGDSEANMSTTLEADRNLVEAQIQVPQEGDAIVRHRLQQRGKNAPLGKSVLVSTQVLVKQAPLQGYTEKSLGGLGEGSWLQASTVEESVGGAEPHGELCSVRLGRLSTPWFPS